MEGYMEEDLGGLQKSFSSVTLLRKRDEPLYNTYLKQLVEFLGRNVVLGISLKPEGCSSDVFKEVMQFIRSSLNTW